FVYKVIGVIYNGYDESSGRRSMTMDRMFRMLGFWTGIFTVMFYVGDMLGVALLFLVQTAFFLTVGYLKLFERMYNYLFPAYCTLFFVGFSWYLEFIFVTVFV